MREYDIQTAIVREAQREGFAYVLYGNATQGTGLLDVFGSYRGRPFWVEVKTPETRNAATPAQKYNIRLALTNGYVSGIVASVEDFQALFEE